MEKAGQQHKRLCSKKSWRNGFQRHGWNRLDWQVCRIATRSNVRDAGYRLVYQVVDARVVVVVIAIGKRENNLVYSLAKERLP